MNDCSKCLWYGNCAFSMPCDCYDPIDSEERALKADVARERRIAREEWREYMEYSDEMR